MAINHLHATVNKLGKYTKLERGISHGCIFTGYLFKPHSMTILREWEDLPGFTIEGRTAWKIQYSQDVLSEGVIEWNSEQFMNGSA